VKCRYLGTRVCCHIPGHPTHNIHFPANVSDLVPFLVCNSQRFWSVDFVNKELLSMWWYSCTNYLFCCVCFILPWLCVYLFFRHPAIWLFWARSVFGCCWLVVYVVWHTLHAAADCQWLALNLWWKWRLGWTASTHLQTCTQQAPPSLSLCLAVKLIPGPRNPQVSQLFRKITAEVSTYWT
jgi:hypothetical protein